MKYQNSKKNLVSTEVNSLEKYREYKINDSLDAIDMKYVSRQTPSI